MPVDPVIVWQAQVPEAAVRGGPINNPNAKNRASTTIGVAKKAQLS